jgi:hypothetical protein
MENANGQPMMSVSGWLPNGMKVFFQMPVYATNAFEDAMAFTNMLQSKGFSQQEPGLGKGEHRELIGSAGRRNKKNKDGTVSPVLDLYAEASHLTFRYMAIYLDTPEDIKTFETVSGIKLDSIPLNKMDAAPGRDNAELVVKFKTPATLVYTNNPDYDETSTDKKPKRLFVRWDGIGVQKEAPSGLNANVGANGGILEGDWNPQTVKDFVTSYQGKLDTEQLLTALRVTRFGEWTHGKVAAYSAADAALKIAQVAF